MTLADYKARLQYAAMHLTGASKSPVGAAMHLAEHGFKCALCDKDAEHLDVFWPYHQENNRCQAHVRAQEQE